jgi:hypothetical protein
MSLPPMVGVHRDSVLLNMWIGPVHPGQPTNKMEAGSALLLNQATAGGEPVGERSARRQWDKPA